VLTARPSDDPVYCAEQVDATIRTDVTWRCCAPAAAGIEPDALPVLELDDVLPLLEVGELLPAVEPAPPDDDVPPVVEPGAELVAALDPDPLIASVPVTSI